MIVYNHPRRHVGEVSNLTGSEPSGIRRLLGQVVAVNDLDRAIESFQMLGLVLSDRSVRGDIGLDTATFGFAGGSYLELVTPIDDDAGVGGTVRGFLDKRGEGPYLTCFEVDDVFAAHDRLVAAGVAVVGPPQAPPPERGIACDVLWLKPRATAGAFMQLLSFRAPAHQEPTHTVGMRLFTHVITAAEMVPALDSFASLGLTPWAIYQTKQWGLETAVLRLPDATNLEIVSPRDTSRSAAAAVAKTMSSRGGHGHYMTVFESADVEALAVQFERDGVPTLGRPVAAPPESPWGSCRQMWVHPRVTHGAFIEFLTLPSPVAATDGSGV